MHERAPRGSARIATSALVLVAGLSSIAAGGAERLEVGAFSKARGAALPEGWQPLTFPKIEQHTKYVLAEDEGVSVVRAEAADSASGLIRQIAIDPRALPIVEWRWKISNVLEKADVRTKAGDDYPARLYIAFEYDPSKLSFWEKAKYEAARLYYGEYPPTAAINYIWEGRAAEGTSVPNPYTNRTWMIVAESGREKVGEWVEERRNLLEDYRAAFDMDPPMISGVAIMTDTDGTGEAATAWYGDITFHAAD